MSSAAGRSILQRLTRSFKTTAPKKSGHDEPEGFPGANIPLPINNRYALLFIFCTYFGSGVALPFLVLRYHLKK